ncbi:hypothetical protein CaCOL14_010397 [Colletotrichum acutatum]
MSKALSGEHSSQRSGRNASESSPKRFLSLATTNGETLTRVPPGKNRPQM